MKKENLEKINEINEIIELLKKLIQIKEMILGTSHMSFKIVAIFQSTPFNTIEISANKILPILQEYEKELEEKIQHI